MSESHSVTLESHSPAVVRLGECDRPVGTVPPVTSTSRVACSIDAAESQSHSSVTVDLESQSQSQSQSQWERIAELGRSDGHAVGVCDSCGERTSVAVQPLITRGPRKGQRRTPWPECRYCHAGTVVPSAEALEGVTPRKPPTVPLVPPELGPLHRPPWPWPS